MDNTDQDEVLLARRFAEDKNVLSELVAPLEEFSDLARLHGFIPVLTYLPSAHSVYAPYVKFYDPSISHDLRSFSEGQRSFLRRIAKKFDLIFIDLIPPLRRAASDLGARELLFFPVNLHFSQRGHEVVAEAIVETLRKKTTRRGIRLFQ